MDSIRSSTAGPGAARRRAGAPPDARASAVLVLAASLCAATSVAATSAAAAAPPAPSSAWTLSLEGADRACRLTLRPDRTGQGAPVAMPPGCRRAFPALTGVVFWSKLGDALHLDDAHGQPLLAFDQEGAGFRTTSPQGERLSLTSVDREGLAALDSAAAASPAKVEIAQASARSTPAVKPAAASSEKPAEVAGRYAVLRDKTHDTGCMVTLDDKAHGPGGTLKARLAPACRDQGIVIFDPVGWEMMAGKLVLTARKGHTTALQTQDDGSWINDPKNGKALSLKRI